MPSQFANKLKGIGKLWNKASKERRKSGNRNWIEEPMTGNFRLTNAKVDTIGANDWLHVALEFVCVSDGEALGLFHTHRCGIDNENSLSFMQRDLERLGVDLDELEINEEEDLTDVLKELIETAPIVRASLKRSGDFLNMRISKLLDIDESELPDLEGAGEEEEEGNDGEEGEGEEESGEEGEEGEEGDGEEEEGETVELVKGMNVSTVLRGVERSGVVLSVNNGKENARIKLDHNSKTVVVGFDVLDVLEGEEGEDE